jgi:hypothetical protein
MLRERGPDERRLLHQRLTATMEAAPQNDRLYPSSRGSARANELDEELLREVIGLVSNVLVSMRELSAAGGSVALQVMFEFFSAENTSLPPPRLRDWSGRAFLMTAPDTLPVDG